MKQFLTIIITILAAISCTNLDEVWAELRDHEERIQRLETLCNKLNSNIEAMQAVLTAMEQSDYVTDIVKVVENGVEVGYRHYQNGNLRDTAANGVYWSATPISGTNQVYCMVTREDGAVITVQNSMRAFGRGLRCVKK